MSKALFEAHEPSAPFTRDVGADGKYNGPDRRREDRRDHIDRRTEVRFELTANDRRATYGRRKGDIVAHNVW